MVGIGDMLQVLQRDVLGAVRDRQRSRFIERSRNLSGQAVARGEHER